MNKPIRFSFIALLALGFSAGAQMKQTQAKQGKSRQDLIQRGRYIVEDIAMCEQCHTQRSPDGVPDREHWLMGGPAQLRPSYNSPDWALVEPRLAGSPPGSDESFIRLLTTGISRTGRPPRPPMPPFRMTKDDAEAVLAYLKSLPK